MAAAAAADVSVSLSASGDSRTTPLLLNAEDRAEDLKTPHRATAAILTNAITLRLTCKSALSFPKAILSLAGKILLCNFRRPFCGEGLLVEGIRHKPPLHSASLQVIGGMIVRRSFMHCFGSVEIGV